MEEKIKEIDRAIMVLVDKITGPVTPDEALKYTQAALNLAHVRGMLVAEHWENLAQRRAARKP